MDNVKNLNTLDKSNAFFDNYLNKVELDLNSDLNDFYEVIGKNDFQDEIEEKEELIKLRNKNQKRYYNINIKKINGLPHVFDDIVGDINKFYSFINPNELLTEDLYNAQKCEKILNDIERKFDRLDELVNVVLKVLSHENDIRQSKFNIDYFKSLNVDEDIKNKALSKYDDLLLDNSIFTLDSYKALKNEYKRKEKIDNIYKILNLKIESNIDKLGIDRFKNMNNKISKQILIYQTKIQYLQDIILKDSEYTKEFNNFLNYFNTIIAYDDRTYDDVKQTYNILLNSDTIKNKLREFEELFISEVDSKKEEEKFIYDKIGIKNLKKSLDYVSANYLDKINEEDRKIVGYIYEKLKDKDCDLSNLSQALNLVVKDIWKNDITSVYNYKPGEDFYFLCSNNQFMDPRYETILITKRELERVNDYSDYQIGFICRYDDNILYITENEDIMSVENYDDLSRLKTPLQLEQEFLNFKISNRIALNGFTTKLEAVYIINDGDINKYNKAKELSNMYGLPLIELKK